MGTISFDAETGAVRRWPTEGITGPVGARIAATVLPGMTAADVDRMYSEYMTRETDPVPYGRRTRVEHLYASGLRGVIVDRRESEGELHSVLVKWDDHPGAAEWYSPRELTPEA